jgi:UDP-N-acetylglucosamine 2-epimerase
VTTPLKILTVVGARPQFVKAAAVGGPLRRRAREILLHTGQHYDTAMSDQFFRELEIPEPDYQLNVGSGTHAWQTAQMLTGIEAAILAEQPDRVLVYGDTNSTLAGALVAAKLGVPIVHVEAGLRSFNRTMPEEVNRVVTDQLSDLLCCPGEHAVANLAAEGIVRGVAMTGDVMLDVLNRVQPRLGPDRVSRFGVTPGEYLLLTVHRAGNTDEPERLLGILSAVAAATSRTVVFPVHPRTRAALRSTGERSFGAIRMVDPAGYLDMLSLQRYARLVMTDSGGMQKEAYWLGVPCVTLRDETEWTETIDAGWNRLVGGDAALIDAALNGSPAPSARPALYGDGCAAEHIVDLVISA